MITIVTGKINTGKTTRLIALHRRLGGDGIAAVKTMRFDRVHTYEALRLSNQETRRLALHAADAPGECEAAFTIGPYRFDKATVAWIRDLFDALIAKAVSPLYFDEIGLLEVCGEGFSDVIRRLLQSGLDLVLVVRDDLLEAFAAHYGVNDYVIDCQEGEWHE